MKFDVLWKIENNSKLIIHDENIFNMVDDKVALTSMRLEDFQLVDDDICFNLIDLKYYKISKFNDDFELIDIDNIYKKYVDAKKSVDYLDELTWVLSRKFVFKKYLEYLKYAFQFNEEFAVIIGDIDHFKKFNDTFGHSFIEEYKSQDNNHNYQELARLLFDLADKELYNAKIDRNLVSSNVKIKKEKSR